MSSLATLDSRSSLEFILDEIHFTLARLETHPLSVVNALAAPFQSQTATWWERAREEKDILLELARALAQINQADDALDLISDTVAPLVRLENKNNRASAELSRFFGNQRPSDFKRPILGNQLESMRSWPTALAASPNTLLQAQGQRLSQAIANADTAVEAERVASQRLVDFRTTGARRTFVDSINGLRKTTHGQLGKVAHDEGLSSNFAEFFFRRESTAPDLSLSSLDRRIAVLDSEAARLRTQRTELATEEENATHARAEADRLADEAALAAARQSAEDAAARIAALENKLKRA